MTGPRAHASSARAGLPLAVAFLTTLGACEDRPGAAPPEPAPAVPAPTEAPTTLWRPVGSWSGTGNRQTESFDVTTGALRLIWEAAGPRDDGAGRLSVTLHSAISGRPLQTIVDGSGPGTDTVLVAASPRVAYLLIESERTRWHLTLEEGVAAHTP